MYQKRTVGVNEGRRGLLGLEFGVPSFRIQQVYNLITLGSTENRTIVLLSEDSVFLHLVPQHAFADAKK